MPIILQLHNSHFFSKIFYTYTNANLVTPHNTNKQTYTAFKNSNSFKKKSETHKQKNKTPIEKPYQYTITTHNRPSRQSHDQDDHHSTFIERRRRQQWPDVSGFRLHLQRLLHPRMQFLGPRSPTKVRGKFKRALYGPPRLPLRLLFDVGFHFYAGCLPGCRVESSSS